MPHIRRRLHFVVMNNIFHTPKDIHTKYDLKGATYKGRYTPSHKIMKKPSDAVRKDLNLLGYNDSLEEALPELAQRFTLVYLNAEKNFRSSESRRLLSCKNGHHGLLIVSWSAWSKA